MRSHLCHTRSQAVQDAIAAGVVGEDAPAVMLFNGTRLTAQVRSLFAAFPDAHFTHCAAVKANPTLRVLQRLVALGMGLEAASVAELEQALRAGAAPAVRGWA